MQHPIIVCIFASTNASATPGAERSDATTPEKEWATSDEPDKDALPTETETVIVKLTLKLIN